MVAITSSHANSVTIASSRHALVRQLAPRLHRSGPEMLFQFLAEVCGGATDPLARLEAYAGPKSETTLDRRDLIRLVVK